MSDAQEETGISLNSLCACCNNRRKATRDKNGNFLQWAYVNGDGSYILPEPYLPKEKKVICTTTGEIFDSAEQAGRIMKCNASHIGECCKNRKKYSSVGKHPITKEPLHWKYYTEYAEPTEDAE